MLTSVGSVSEEQFRLQFDMMRRCPNTYFVAVLEDKKSGKIIGCATLLLEYKFIHSAGEGPVTRVGTALNAFWTIMKFPKKSISSWPTIRCYESEKMINNAFTVLTD